MSNKEFYEKILQYEQDGLLMFSPKAYPSNFVKMRIMPSSHISISADIIDFAKEISEKVQNNQFFTQKALESHLGVSASVLMRLVIEEDYIRFSRGSGDENKKRKFYIKKDW